MIFFDPNKINKPILTKNLVFLIIIIYFFWLFKQYYGTHHSAYIHMFKYTQGLFSYKYDIFVQSSLQPRASILYTIFNYLKINLDNDYVGFLLHILFTSVAGYFLFRFIKDFTPIKETNGALIAIFSLLVIDFTLVQATRSSWVYSHTGTPTYFAHSLNFVFLWLLIKRSSVWLFIFGSLLLLLGLKHTWFVIGTGIVYSIIFFRPLKKNYWILGPLIAAIYLSTIVDIQQFNYNEKLTIFNNIIARDQNETAFHLQTLRHLISLIISFPIFLIMLLKLENSKLKNLSFVILILSFFCFVFGYFYSLYGGKIWPEPRLQALSPTRALFLYQLFFWILVLIWIYKSNFYSIIKIALFCSMFYGFTGVWKNSYSQGLILFLFIMILVFFTIKIFKNKNLFNLQNLILDRSSKFSTFMTFLFFLLLLPGVTYLFSISLKNADFYALKKINKWTVGSLINNHDRLDNAIDLQKCNDFILLDLDYPMRTTAVSGKSQFYERGFESTNFFDLKLLKIGKKRQKIFENLEDSLLNKITISKEDIKELYNLEVVLILKDGENKFFPENTINIDLKNNDMLLLFLNDLRKKDFMNNCKPNLRT